MAKTRPAGPTDWKIACFGEFQNAVPDRRPPVCGDAMASERDQVTGAGVVTMPQNNRWIQLGGILQPAPIDVISVKTTAPGPSL